MYCHTHVIKRVEVLISGVGQLANYIHCIPLGIVFGECAARSWHGYLLYYWILSERSDSDFCLAVVAVYA